jgi:hypothetical protein
MIWFAMVLSRLIRDNGHSFAFIARIVDHEDGMQQVIPVNAPDYIPTYRARRDRAGSRRARQPSSASSSTTTGR